jgi:hypothetical protein
MKIINILDIDKINGLPLVIRGLMIDGVYQPIVGEVFDARSLDNDRNGFTFSMKIFDEQEYKNIHILRLSVQEERK